jgi:aminopeptidase N
MKFFGILLLLPFSLMSQNKTNHQDTLRGSINSERTWWNLLRYELSVKPDYHSKTIKGENRIYFEMKEKAHFMQIDLQSPMNIDSVICEDKKIKYLREGNVFHLNFSEIVFQEKVQKLCIYFSGKPREAINPPWDGGWIWTKDEKGRPWMSVACQGLGASVWYPCKDHQSDEPENGVSMTIIIPDTLVAVSNGRIIDTKEYSKGFVATTWEVKNPINNYNVIPYIGKYVHWGENYQGENGNLSCDYWVLDYELERAKVQFKQVPSMLKSFEHWFGPYPFYEDGYKLVQSPYLGMEHQSAVAYGNNFQNGYLGRDLSGSGWGKKWDYILVHESGHEWFGNNITTKDIADMWVHEGFTTYSETIYTTCLYGVKAGNEYQNGLRSSIRNDQPIIGQYSVNKEGSGDMYYKGSNLIHMIRQLMDDDEKFRQLLRGLNETFWHKTVTTGEIENYISNTSGTNCSKIFDQYLRTIQIPKLEYKIENDNENVLCRWTDCVPGFDMKIRLNSGIWVFPTEKWTVLPIKLEKREELLIDSNFYIKVKKIND